MAVAAAVMAVVLLAVARSIWFVYHGTLPTSYYALAVLSMAGLGLACGALGAALLVAGTAALRRPLPVSTAALGGVAGAVLPFAALHVRTPLRAPFSVPASVPLEDLLEWGPALLVLLAIAWLATRGAALRTALWRLGGLTAAAVLLGIAGGIAGSIRDHASELDLPLHPTARRHPPVLVVLVDTLRADHLSAYGYEHRTSPNVDALAADGTLYERAFSPSSWTRPACAALFTSRHPRELGVERTWDALPSDIPLLPELFEAEGYATGGIISSVQLNPQYGFGRGFQTMDLGTNWVRYTGLHLPLVRLRLISRTDDSPRYDAQELTDRAIAWIDEQSARDRPIFLYLHYADPHSPYEPPADQDRWREFAEADARSLAHPPEAGPTADRPFSSAELGAFQARYDAEIAFFDDHFGRLLRHLEARGLYDEMLIVFTSDHGEEFGEHGRFGHAHSLENELLHVPLIVKLPAEMDGQRGGRSREIAGLVDVLPTLRDALGARWPSSGSRGRSLLTEGSSEPEIYARNAEPPLRAIHRGEHKLLQVLDGDEVVAERYYRLGTLGDVGAGTGAQGVIPTDPPEALESLRRRISQLAAPRRDPRRIRVDDETHAELVALGYVE